MIPPQECKTVEGRLCEWRYTGIVLVRLKAFARRLRCREFYCIYCGQFAVDEAVDLGPLIRAQRQARP